MSEEEEAPPESSTPPAAAVAAETTTTTAAETATTATDENNGPGSFDIDDRRRLKHMAYVTSGCGKNKEKDRIVGVFWELAWPALEKQGWKKVDGTDGNAGSMFFYPKGSKEGEGTKGRDFYDRIKDVLDRLREKRTFSEGSVIEKFDAEVYRREEEETKSSRKRKASESAGGGSGSSSTTPSAKKSASEKSNGGRKSAKLDSWKEGRKFVKKTSRVGADYQPSSLPNVGDKPEVEGEPTILFSPEAVVEAGKPVDDVAKALDSVSPNKKFEVLCKLAQQGYNIEDVKSIEDSIPFTDGSDWDDEKKLQFSQEIFKSKKNFAAVCKAMGIEMQTCLVYYYREFKSSTDYRLMKTIMDDERYEKTANFETNMDVCAICDDGGELVICDECEGEYHLKCMRPPLKVVPIGRWECDECVDRKVLRLRNFLLNETKLAKENKETEDEEGQTELVHSDEALNAVRKFGKKISQLLAPPDAGEVEVKPEEIGEEEEV